jgi:hypothetical protein
LAAVPLVPPGGAAHHKTREVLQRVAVVGTTLDTDQFVALSGLPEGEAYVELDTALAALVLERTGSSYRFRHALVREALAVADPVSERRLPARMARAAISAGDLDTATAALDGLELDGGPADSLILLARGGYAYFSGDLDDARRYLATAERSLTLWERDRLAGCHPRGARPPCPRRG